MQLSQVTCVKEPILGAFAIANHSVYLALGVDKFSVTLASSVVY